MKVVLIISIILNCLGIFGFLIIFASGLCNTPFENGFYGGQLISTIFQIIVNCVFLNWVTHTEEKIERLDNKLINLSNRIERRTYISNDIPNQKRLTIKQKQPIQNLNAPLDYSKIPATYRIECPKCNNMLTVYDDDIIIYCNKCGQKIQIN